MVLLGTICCMGLPYTLKRVAVYSNTKLLFTYNHFEGFIEKNPVRIQSMFWIHGIIKGYKSNPVYIYFKMNNIVLWEKKVYSTDNSKIPLTYWSVFIIYLPRDTIKKIGIYFTLCILWITEPF